MTEGALQVRVWDSVCRHIDGVVIGTTMAALGQHGALAILASAERTGFGALRRRLNANAGYLTVAIRLLADQGWLTCAGEMGTDALTVEPTDAGRAVMTEYAPGYQAAARSLPLAARILDAPAGPFLPVAAGILDAPASADLSRFAGLMRREWDLPPPSAGPGSAQARRQVLAHLDGHLLAPLMYALTGRDAPVVGVLPVGSAAEILALRGWAHVVGDQAKLTAAGEVALALAGQYRYPMVYLPLLRRVPALIFGDPGPAVAEGAETHLDRELDIRFSGDVFASVCRTPFLDIALPLFDRGPVSAQPALVVDTGCGDGTMLAALYAAILERTVRGRQIAAHPLLMVGADPSPVARRVAASRLAAAGVPHLIMDGDIADPGALGRALAARGLDPANALHVCKSAIHDRVYHPSVPAAPPIPVAPHTPGVSPAVAGEPAAAPPPCSGAYALPDGTAIPATRMALDLAAFFRRWRPVTGRHGWLVIEAHAVPPATTARLLGRTVVTALDATHGYSGQYPVEPEVFAWAAATAGFRSRAHAEPAASALGHTLLTIDHFVAKGP